MNAIERLRQRVGSYRKIAKVCGISDVAVRKWAIAGHLPRTEWCGMTNYARRLADHVGDPGLYHELLAATPDRAAEDSVTA